MRAEIVLVIVCLLFIGLTLIARSDALRHWDAHLSHIVQHSRTPFLLAIARGFTMLGNGLTLSIISVPIVLWLWSRKRRMAAVLVPAAILGHILNMDLKAIVNRARPGLPGDGVTVFLPAPGSSFPSGHAMTAVMYFGFLAVLAAIYITNPRVRTLAIGFLVSIVLAISWSRIYAGAHFFSDVIGGIAAGLFFLICWTEAYKRLAPQEFGAPVSNPPPAGESTAATD